MSFACERSWCLLDIEGKGDSEHNNPSIIVLTQVDQYTEDFGMELFDVNSHPYFKEQRLQKFLSPEEYQEFDARRNEWKQDPDKTPEIRNWMQCMLLSRSYDYPPNDLKIYHGILHDCYTVKETNRGDDPVPDPNEWEQYCIKTKGKRMKSYFGDGKIFLEFKIEWDEWSSDSEALRNQASEEMEANIMFKWKRDSAAN
ncbi:MAG: hypothetical protein SGILL_008222 [Bacillariaceae sp.]